MKNKRWGKWRNTFYIDIYSLSGQIEELFSNMLSITSGLFSIPCMHQDHKLYNWNGVASFCDYATHQKNLTQCRKSAPKVTYKWKLSFKIKCFWSDLPAPREKLNFTKLTPSLKTRKKQKNHKLSNSSGFDIHNQQHIMYSNMFRIWEWSS